MSVAMKLEIEKQIHTARFRVWIGDKLEKWVVINHYESWFWTISASHSYSITMVFIHVYQIQFERCCNVYFVYHISNHGYEIKSIVMTSFGLWKVFRHSLVRRVWNSLYRCTPPYYTCSPWSTRDRLRNHSLTPSHRWCPLWYSIPVLVRNPSQSMT